MDLNQIMGVLNSRDGLKQMMMQPAFQNEDGSEFSQADLIADVVNIERMDLKRLAHAVSDIEGVDEVAISVDKMTPERAAALLQGVAKGDDLGLIDIFDELEDQRMTLLAALTDEETVEGYIDLKQSVLYTVPDQQTTITEEINSNGTHD